MQAAQSQKVSINKKVKPYRLRLKVSDHLDSKALLAVQEQDCEENPISLIEMGRGVLFEYI